MEQHSSPDLIDIEELQPVHFYGAFWPRLGALIIDGIILLPLTFLSFYNNIAWKSEIVLVGIALIGLVYKSFFEYLYGATPGKMVIKLRVVNNAFEKASLEQILLRNILFIGSRLLSLCMSLYIFRIPAFKEATTLIQYTNVSKSIHEWQIGNYLLLIALIIDTVFLLSDEQKRSLHDRIARTYVVRTELE